MAIIKCKECKKEVSSNAKNCPHCGNPVKKDVGFLPGCLIILLALIFIPYLIFSSFVGNETSSSSAKPQNLNKRKDAKNSVNMLIDSGYIKKVDPNMNKVYVDKYLWASMNVSQKEMTSMAIAYYCGYEKGTNLFWVDVYDWENGKRLAKYSESWGFKIY